MAGEPPFYVRAVDADATVSRGDIASLHLPQTRVRGETAPPADRTTKQAEVPAYINAFRLLDDRMSRSEVEVWPALAVVVMDSCELDRQLNAGRSPENWDSRVAVAPLIFEPHLHKRHWERFERGEVPLYGFYLPSLETGI